MSGVRRSRAGLLDEAPARKPGFVLIPLECTQARRKAQQLGFQLVTDPVDFVKKVSRAAKQKGNVVLTPPSADTDYALSSAVVAALLGCFCAAPRDFQEELPKGLQYEEKYKSSKQSFHIAVSAELAEDLPTMPQVLRAIAEAPGSCLSFYRSERKLGRFYKRELKKNPKAKPKAFVFFKRTPSGADAPPKELQELYIRPRSFLLQCPASHRVVCPGCRPRQPAASA